LGLPVIELAVFAAVAAELGLAKAIALTIVTSLIGLIVLRQAGRTRLNRFRTAASSGTFTTLETHARDLFTVLGGILLVIPGFVTDVVGALLLLRPVQRWIGATVRRALLGRQRRTPDSVVDLDRSEWDRLPEKELADRRRPGPA
jgi:UPF0716 protein FxsA